MLADADADAAEAGDAARGPGADDVQAAPSRSAAASTEVVATAARAVGVRRVVTMAPLSTSDRGGA
ncbi:hypothetical protein GCM10022379_34250 [Micromonospora maritima]